MYRLTLEKRVFIVQAVTADILARTFQNMACRVQSCLDANVSHFKHVMMSSHFSHNERTAVQISLQYLHWC
jgi:hypothetical protein